MIKISKSANFNNTPWLPLYSKTQYVGNPIPLSCTAIEIHPKFAPNNSQPLSQTSTTFGKFNDSFTTIISPPPSLLVLLAEPFLKPQQFNCILWMTTKAQNNIKIMPYSPMPLKIGQVGNLQNIICDLSEVLAEYTKKIKRPSNNSLNKNWRHWSYSSNIKTFPKRRPQQNWSVLKLYVPILKTCLLYTSDAADE